MTTRADLGQPFSSEPIGGLAVRGFLHRPMEAPIASLVLAHGASGSARTPLLIALGVAFAARGLAVLRCDLPYRQRRAAGPPSPATAEVDRAGLRRAVSAMAETAAPTFLGGLSYGGRQATMLAAADAEVATGLLLLSYPLHPPGRAEAQRTQHFPALSSPALFVHGTRDPFGTIAELRAALNRIPASTSLVEVAGAGHDLGGGRRVGSTNVVALVVDAFFRFFALR